MEKQDLTLEEILSEYTSGDGTPEDTDAGPVLSEEELAIAEAVAHAESTRKPPKRKKSAQNRTKVGFVQATAEPEPMPMRVNVPSGQKQSEPEPVKLPSFSDNTPKIRRMSDSTRAREIAKNKKKKKKSKTAGKQAETYTYDKERPEGEYLYTQIHGVKRTKTRKKSKRAPALNAAGTETIHINLRDVVPVKQTTQAEPVQPVEVKPAPRAEKTSLDLSKRSGVAEANDLDVTIKRTQEEAEAETRKRQEKIDMMELENVSDIRFDIAELRSSINFRIGAMALVLLISGFLALGDVIHIPYLENMHPILLAVIQTLLGLSACVACFPVLRNGFHRLLTFSADTDSMAAVALTASMISSAVNIVTTIVVRV